MVIISMTVTIVITIYKCSNSNSLKSFKIKPTITCNHKINNNNSNSTKYNNKTDNFRIFRILANCSKPIISLRRRNLQWTTWNL